MRNSRKPIKRYPSLIDAQPDIVIPMILTAGGFLAVLIGLYMLWGIAAALFVGGACSMALGLWLDL